MVCHCHWTKLLIIKTIRYNGNLLVCHRHCYTASELMIWIGSCYKLPNQTIPSAATWQCFGVRLPSHSHFRAWSDTTSATLDTLVCMKQDSGRHWASFSKLFLFHPSDRWLTWKKQAYQLTHGGQHDKRRQAHPNLHNQMALWMDYYTFRLE